MSFPYHPMLQAMRFHSGAIGWVFPAVQTVPVSGTLPPKSSFTPAGTLSHPPPPRTQSMPLSLLQPLSELDSGSAIPSPLLPFQVCLPGSIRIYPRRNPTSESPRTNCNTAKPCPTSTTTRSPIYLHPLHPPQNWPWCPTNLCLPLLELWVPNSGSPHFRYDYDTNQDERSGRWWVVTTICAPHFSMI